MMTEFRHAFFAATVCFVVLVAAGMSAVGADIFSVPVLAVLAVVFLPLSTVFDVQRSSARYLAVALPAASATREK
jgi:hypothetical protein